MDTSEVYVRMCKEAKELQNWTHKDLTPYDYVALYDNTIVNAAAVLCGLSSDVYTLLFRQDQLQEMVKDPKRSILGLITDLYNWILANYLVNRAYITMEQLWLEYVMWEKFGETWNGKGWIKTDVKLPPLICEDK